MIPLVVILIYLAIVAYIGSVAFRRGKQNTEDFFLAGRSIGPLVFFLSLFATNMTAFAILGSSGAAYKRGIGIFGMMASSSALIIPLTIFLIGTRIWALGKRFGHQTQVQLFRDRWECRGIGTAIFALSAAMLIPYMIISIIGGGRVLADISIQGNGQPLIPYALGCAIVALVVTLNVFFGGMRGIVWVNIFQTILFMLFGTVAALVISHNLPGGFGETLSRMGTTANGLALITRERMPQEEFWSYTFIPLSSIMFPHMSIMCLSARKMSAFKNTVIAYPIAIMSVWLPCVFLGVVGAAVIPGLEKSDGVLLHLLSNYAPVWLAGLLGAGIISAVMGSDCHQVLALSTMFTKDVFAYYGGKEKYGERGSVMFARAFILVVTVAAYFIALKASEGIFELAVRFAFSGFAAMAPVMVAALFWKRSTKWGALASTIWVGACLLGTWAVQSYSDPIAPRPPGARTAGRAPRMGAAGGGAAEMAARPGGAAGARNGIGRGGASGGRGESAGGGRQSGAQMGRGGAAPGESAGGGRQPGGQAAGRGGVSGGRGGSAGRGGAPGRSPAVIQVFPALGDMFLRNPTTVTIYGFLPVVPMVIGSAILMIAFSLATRPPSKETIARYFPSKAAEREPAVVEA